MEQNCNEQILEDVVRVDLVPASECHLPIPFSVVGITEMAIPNLSDWRPQTAIASLGAAELSIAYNVQDGDDGFIESSPKLTQTPKTELSGLVITHDLQVPVVGGFEATEKAANFLHRRDFNVILTTQNDGLFMIYSLPNTCEVLLPESNIRQEGTLKISTKSRSHVIRLKDS